MDADVLVVGAGPAGLSAAAELRRLGVGRVLVADREAEPGGVPRHSWHTGYGLRDLRRVLTGPAYARVLADAAVRAGAELRTGCTVTGIVGPGAPASASPSFPPAFGPPATPLITARSVTLSSRCGAETVHPAAVLLATGCRERPRAARLVPGDRPAGVMTTGELQQRVYLNGERLSGRALVVGAEHVSFSAAMTLAHAGARVIALVTEHRRQQSYAAFRLAAALRWRVPVWTSAVPGRIAGRDGRLAGVDLAFRGGGSRYVPCELLVFTGDWIPDHELARTARLAIDPGTRGPAVDTALATSAPGVFAAGNLVHAAETADVAALSGCHAARHIAAYLAGHGAGSGARIPVAAEPPLAWISPNAVTPGTVTPGTVTPGTVTPGTVTPLTPGAPPLGRFTLRGAEFRGMARIEVRQDGRLLARSLPRRLIPGRPVHLAAGWLARVDPGGGALRVRVT